MTVGLGTGASDGDQMKEPALLELLVHSVVDYAIFALDPDGNVSTWNAGAKRLKGYDADEIIGRHFSAFYGPEDQRAGIPQSGLRTATEAGTWEHEGWRLRKDGTRFWADVVITALRGEDGELRGFAKVTRDLTERKRNEDALLGIIERERNASEQLRAVDAMRRELVAMVAHDLRGPVSVIGNLLELLLEQWDELEEAERRRRIRRVMERTEGLAALTDDVFDIALIDAGRLEVRSDVVDVAAVAARAARDVESTEDEQRILVSADPMARALGDERRIWQILTNLLSNALKFSPGPSPVCLDVARAGDHVLVTVQDEGPGIPGEDRERIFARFTRLDHGGGAPGSGLGLFIVRHLVEAQGGSVAVDSEVGRGTRFRVLLPAV